MEKIQKKIPETNHRKQSLKKLPEKSLKKTSTEICEKYRKKIQEKNQEKSRKTNTEKNTTQNHNLLFRHFRSTNNAHDRRNRHLIT